MRLLSAIVLVTAVACSPASQAPTSSASPSRVAQAAASPSPVPFAFPSLPPDSAAVPPASVSCVSPIAPGSALALVTLKGAAGVAVRDITDINHAVTRCVFSGGTKFRFYDATHVSYVVEGSNVGSPGSLYLADLKAGTTSLIRTWTSGALMSDVYAWSPDGKALTYVDSTTIGVWWHILTKSGDTNISPTLGTIVARGASPDDDAMVGFSADGKYAAIEETFTTGGQAGFQIYRTGDGTPLFVAAGVTMAAWAGSGATLYFRDSGGVEAWDPSGGVRPVATGLSWAHPWASSDGKSIVFSTVGSQGNDFSSVMDLGGGSVKQLSAQPRVHPVFLTPNVVWYQGESLCTPGTCGLGGPPITAPYLYEFATSAESPSIDTAVYDSWPHVQGQV